MEPGDVVRVLHDRTYGYAPIGSIDEIREGWARVKLDEPEHWGRDYSWFMVGELEVVDIEAWERAIRRDVA